MFNFWQNTKWNGWSQPPAPPLSSKHAPKHKTTLAKRHTWSRFIHVADYFPAPGDTMPPATHSVTFVNVVAWLAIKHSREIVFSTIRFYFFLHGTKHTKHTNKAGIQCMYTPPEPSISRTTQRDSIRMERISRSVLVTMATCLYIYPYYLAPPYIPPHRVNGDSISINPCERKNPGWAA